MHADELEIDDQLVRRLIDRDRPELRERPLRRLPASGSSNVQFRVGDDRLARLPRQPGGSAAIEKEARWLPRLAARLPVAVPEVDVLGAPGFGYPERWALVRWIEGETPATPVPDGPAADALALDLAAFVTALHDSPLPSDAATRRELRSYRGGPLAAVDAPIRQYLAQCRSVPGPVLDVDACIQLWDEAVALPAGSGVDRWIHGDLLAENVLLRDGRLAAVLDFGALAVGDPSVDLIVGWEVLGPQARAVFRSALAVDETTWLRGRGWALAIAVMTFPYYWASMPERCAARLAMAQQVLADFAT